MGLKSLPASCILNIEWTAEPSRDRLAASLVSNYLRLQGHKVVEGSIFDTYRLVCRYKPRLVFITNSIGAELNHKIVKYLRKRKIPVISFISEGNFFGDEEYLNQMIWGWNKDRILYENYQLQWTERTVSLTCNLYPELREKIAYSGAIGFDKYKIDINFDLKEKLLKEKFHNKFQHVIGVSGWAFNLFFPGSQTFEVYNKIYSREDIERFQKDHINFNNVLHAVIKRNPNKLFILKEHPAAKGEVETGFSSLSSFDNVYYVRNEIEIKDCISISDFWLVYDSTTMLEAWLLSKPTAMINPNGEDFLRDNLYKGNPNLKTANEICTAIQAIFEHGEFKEFDDLSGERIRLIENVLQWSDGMNHVRAGNFILNFLEKEETTTIVSESFTDKKEKYLRMIKNLVLSILYRVTKKNKYKRVFKVDDTKTFSNALMQKQKKFYLDKNQELGSLRKLSVKFLN